MTDIDLIKQALEYLEDNQHHIADNERHAYVMLYNDVITALKERLAQEKALQALHDENERLGLYKDAYAEQEPVAVKRMKEWVEFLKRQSDNGQHMNIPSSFGAGTCWELAIELEQFINTHPPQRNPLTEEQIVAKALHLSGLGTSPDVLQFARAIEAAHGIEEDT
jgi:hypothetical protein